VACLALKLKSFIPLDSPSSRSLRFSRSSRRSQKSEDGSPHIRSSSIRVGDTTSASLYRASLTRYPVGKILKDDETVESYKIEEKGFVVCVVNKVRPLPQCPSGPGADQDVSSTAEGDETGRCRCLFVLNSSPGDSCSGSDCFNPGCPSSSLHHNLPGTCSAGHADARQEQRQYVRRWF
jgi:hypothetical protein